MEKLPFEILLLLALFFFIRRRSKLSRLLPSHFPSVPARAFLDWRRKFILSTDIVIVASVVTFVPALIVRAFFFRATTPQALLWLLGLALTGWLAALVNSAIIGTKASRDAKKLGIEWRKRA